MTLSVDVCIIGSGVGGSSIAWSLRKSGLSVLVVERGDVVPREAANSDPVEVFDKGRYSTREDWVGPDGKVLGIRGQYFVGGASKMFGAAMFRFRPTDFTETFREGGISPRWPFSYEDLEPWYGRAETLFDVHGETGSDITEGPRSTPFPARAVRHAAGTEALRRRLVKAGANPFPLPLAIDDGGLCIRCGSCDAFPCRIEAKGDAEVRILQPALQSSNVRLITNALVRRLETTPDGRRVVRALVDHDGHSTSIEARHFVLSGGAINSARLLLQSGGQHHQRGLANGSDQVGRNLMLHQNSAMICFNPLQKGPIDFQKSLAITEFYEGSAGGDRCPRGSIQSLGKVPVTALAATLGGIPPRWAGCLLGRTVEWWLTSEDLPDPENRVSVDADRTIVAYRHDRLAGHKALIRHWRKTMRKAGWPLSFTQTMGATGISHQCGTARAGSDPHRSVVDSYCKAHDVENLHIVDGSFFPSSGAVNPALTIAAQALRVGDRLACDLTQQGVAP